MGHPCGSARISIATDALSGLDCSLMSTTQGFTLGFVLPPFQGLIAGLISMPDTSLMDRTIESRSSSAPVGAGFWEWALFHEFRPDLRRDSTRGYSLSPLRGEGQKRHEAGISMWMGRGRVSRFLGPAVLTL